MAFVTSRGIQVWWESTGVGAPVVLVNGLGSVSTVWHRLAPRLSADFQVITFDNRGVGRSAIPCEPYALADMSADAVAVLDAARVETAHVLGMSLGGLIAQDLALTYPGRVRSLVLASTHRGLPFLGEGDPEVVQKLLNAGKLPPAERAEALISVQYSDRTPRDRIALDHEIGVIHPSSPEGFAGQLAAAGTWQRVAELPTLRMPVLVIHGRDDRLVPLPAGQDLAAAIPGSDLRIIEGAGHQVFTDAELEVASEILSFLHAADSVQSVTTSSTTSN